MSKILNILLALTVTQDQICSLKCKLIVLFLVDNVNYHLFYKVKIVKLEELLDNMKTTKGNVPSPGEYVLLKKKQINYDLLLVLPLNGYKVLK